MQGIIYDSPSSLKIVDQLLLPHHKVLVDIKTVKETYGVISKMQVRGAPAIAIVAMLGLSVHLQLNPADEESIDAFLTLLSNSRPTAVNLFNAIAELKEMLKKNNNKIDVVKNYAETLLKNDKLMCESISNNGVNWILDKYRRASVIAVTICNTGSLATAGSGTALGIIKGLYKIGMLEHCYYLETRPYNQGARLTSVELLNEGIPSTMICDSMVGFLLKRLNEEQKRVVVVVGADRITGKYIYNKIGTLNLAIISQFYNIPFVVAAPSTTFSDSEKTTVEERPGDEMTTINGLYNGDIVNVQISPNVKVWNPAFDMVERELVSSIISEK